MYRQQTMQVIGLLSRFSVVLALAATAAAIPPPVQRNITSIQPSIGRPTGGEMVRINGSGFTAPVRVLFGATEGFVVSYSERHLEVLTPAVLMPLDAQQLVSDVKVIVGEHSMVAENAFTFRNGKLTPRIDTLTPRRGSVNGGLRVSVFGEGFQPPVQVLFVAPSGVVAEGRVIQVHFNEVVLETVPAVALGVGPGEAVDLRIRNIDSMTETVLHDAFTYSPKMSVSGVSPAFGPASGGTSVRISGTGFNVPVVHVAGVPAVVTALTPTEVVARTSPADIENCEDRTGTVQVLDLQSGEVTEGGTFTYAVQPVEIAEVYPRVATPGMTVEATLANVTSGFVTLTLGNLVSFPTPVVDSKVRVMIPSGMIFPGPLCKPQPVTFDLRITDGSGCSTVLPAAVTVHPHKRTGCSVIVRKRP